MYPEYAEVNGKQYKINTDFRVALECNKIAEDKSIGDFERSLAIIYKLYGDEGINSPDDYNTLLEIGQRYLLCDKEYKKSNEKPDMDYEQDYGLIWASMYGDYNGLDIDKIEMHWWKFSDLMDGLSNSELGNCCVFNRVRNFRRINPKEIKDPKERQKVIELQKQVALKKYQVRKEPTKEQKERANNLYKQLGIERK